MSNDKQFNVKVEGNVLTILEGQSPKPYQFEGYKYDAG
jgi:hypothetical protein